MTRRDNSRVIEYLELSAGMGKTYSTIKWIVEEQIPQGNKWVYVAPSKELINETAQVIESIDDSVDFCIITDDYFKGVMVNTIDLLKENTSDIYLITHANLENIITKCETHIFEGFNVVVDELPSVFNMHDISLSNESDFIKSRLVKSDDYDNVLTLDKSKTALENLKKDGERNGSKKITYFAKALKETNTVLRQEMSDYVVYQTYSVLDYKDFIETSNRVVFLGAKINNTLTSGLLERQGISFEVFNDVKPIRSEYLNQERVTIYYLTDENVDSGCTSSLLNAAFNLRTGKKLSYREYRHLPNGMDDLDEGFVNVYQEYVNRACDKLGEDFLYTVNYIPKTKVYKDVMFEGVPYGTCIPYGCHGLNGYSHYTKVLSLFCYKPSPLHKSLLAYLKVLYDFPDIEGKYIDMKYKDASYQVCTRSALRRFDLPNEKIEFIVPDIDVAHYIKDNYIPACVIDNSLALYIPDNRENNGGLNKDILAKKFNLDKKESAKFRNFKSYFRKTKGREPTEEECNTKINNIISKRG